MIVEYPLLWITPAFMVGLMLGGVIPFPGAIGLLAMWVLLSWVFRRQRGIPEVLTLLFWLTLGSARMSAYEAWQGGAESAWKTHLDTKLAGENERLAERLGRAGVEGASLRLSEALVLGQKKALPREVRHAFNQVGAGHLLALSGMHLGIIYGLLFALFIRPVLFSKWRWLTLPPLLLLIWGYAVLTGMPVSLVRAAIMLSIFTVAAFLQNSMNPLHPLALSALLILLWHPDSLRSVGFQLSFVAVFFIFLLYLPLHEAFPSMRGWKKLLLLSLVAQLGTAPLCIYYFHTLPLLSAVVGLLLVPLTSLIIYVALFTLLTAWPLAGILLTALTHLQTRLVGFFAALPGMSVEGLYPQVWQVVLCYLLIGICCLRIRTSFKAEMFKA